MNIVVIGSTGGIGSCLISELSTSHNLYLGYRNNQKFLDLKNKINSKNLLDGDLINIDEFDSFKDFFEKANQFLGSIDCIINCVGSLYYLNLHI